MTETVPTTQPTTSMRTNRFYFRIKFWLLDRVVHVIYVIACWLARLARGPGSYRKYLKKDGRFKFQVDLGIEILNYAIGKEWTDLNEPPPQWMRQTDWLPCECGKCFFCLNGLTNGIGHRKKRTRTIFVQHDNSRTMTTDCTTKRVGLKRGSQHCRMCYRKQCNGTEEERARSKLEKQKACNSSTMGCPSCDELICK